MLASSRKLLPWTALCLTAFLMAAPAPADAASAAAGQGHSVVCLPDGTVWLWGANDRGQMGDGTLLPSLTPSQVPGLSGVVAVASGDAHVLALTGTGEVWAWGANGHGQTGDGTSSDRLVPVVVLTGAVGIDAGLDYSLAWKADGSLWTWGSNETGPLGDGTLLPSDTPAAITGVTGVAQASAGAGHVLALTTGGTIWAWGLNTSGQLGDGTQETRLSPVLVTAVPDALSVEAGAGASYAIRSDSLVWAWGSGTAGQLGDGTTTSRLTAAPAGVPAPVVSVAAGGGHVLARLADGALWSWGLNSAGQAGDGTRETRLTPAALPVTGVAEIAAGLEHSLAVTTEGVVWAWGRNHLGQLGDGTTEDQAAPVAISGPGFSWKVGRPVLDPPGGTYEASQDVTLTSATADAAILYTTDGTAPDEAGPSTASGGVVPIDETTTLKAQAVKTDRTPSDIVTAEYTLQVPAVTFSPEAGTYTEPQTVTLSCVEPADIRYTTDGAEPDESSALYADPVDITENATLKARAFKAGWEPSEVSSADYEVPTTTAVVWTDLVGVTAAGSTLQKLAGGASAWDAGAVSTKALASGDGWVEVALETTGSTQMFGLARGQSGQGYADIDFALYVNGSSLYVYESGVSRASLGAAAAGDSLRVAVDGGVVRYLKNDVELHVSAVAPGYPLLVDTSIKNPGGQVSNATLSGLLSDVVLEAPGTPVVWTDLVGVTAIGSTLEKSSGASAWDAGAVSTKAIASGSGWVEAVAAETGSTQMFGLSDGNSGQGYGDIDFALYVNGSSLYAYEGGVSRGSLGPVTQGDRLRVVVEAGAVHYVRNGNVLLTSGTAPTFPLLVDTSVKNPGGRVSQVTVSGALADVVLEAPGTPVVWGDLVGTVATANTLEKVAATSAWDAGAVSTKGIASGDGWAEAVVETTTSTQMFGLSDGNSGEGYGDIDFALYVSGSSLYAYEGGASRGSLGAVAQGDRLRVVVAGGAVRYERNGKTLLVSGMTPSYPLLVDTSIKNPGGRVSSVTISGLLTDVPPPPLGVPVQWMDLEGVEAEGNTLEKPAEGLTAWDAGAVSTKAIAGGDGWVEAAVETTTSTQMFGLSDGNSGQGYGDIDFALYVNGASLYVYEGGVQRASLGAVTQGDRLRVVVAGGTVQYHRNDQELWTSATSPTHPLLVDTSIRNPGGRISDVTVAGTLVDVVLEAPGTPVEWMALVGVEAAANTLEKPVTGESSWNEGAVSTKAIASGDGWVEAVVETTTSTQMFGLAHGQSGEGYGDIDFALYVNGSSLYAYEDGVSRGSLGPVVQGDRLRVVVEDGAVSYVRNGKTLLASAGTPTLPLLVDASIQNPGGQVSQVTLSGAFTDVILDPPGLPVEWTDLVGVVADQNTLAKPAGSPSAWDGGATSTAAFLSGDGWVEAVIEATTSTQMFGLSSGDTDQGYADIDFALYLNGASLYAYESGTSRGSLGPVAPGDRLRVVVEGGAVRYLRNGKELLVSAGTPSWPLLVDTSLKNPGGRIARVTVSGDDLQLRQPAAPTMDPAGGLFSSPVTVTLAAVTPGATVRYTTDGSDPTEASPAYTAPLTLDTTTDLRARAFKPGWDPSPVAMALYQLNYGTLASPTIAPAAGTYETSVEVTLDGPVGASLFYTTDGSAPTTGSTPYTGPFALTLSATVRAASFHPDWTPSAVAEAAYEISVATPSFNPPAGSYAEPQDVAITTATPGATLTYTTDGSDPTEADPSLAVGETVRVDQTLTLKARAWKAGATPSDVAAAGYTLAGQAGMVSAGDIHSLALTSQGEVWAWGGNWSGQLGTGTLDHATYPVRVTGLSDVVSIAAGGEHNLAVDSAGGVWAWGYNGEDQLGDGSGEDQPSPVPVTGLSDVVAVAAGYEHSLALDSTGTVWAWGAGWSGQLGDGTTDGQEEPVAVPGLTGIVAIAAGEEHSVALKSDGTLWAWGANWMGQIGNGTTDDQLVPVAVAGLTGVTAFAAGGAHTLAVTSDGTTWAWGANWSGQIGDGTDQGRLAPVVVAGLTDVVAVAAGYEHSFAVTSTGALWAWGYNGEGQLGDGTTDDQAAPVAVSVVTGVAAASAGTSHSLALTQDGQVYAWGSNDLGQLGLGFAGASQASPDAISGPDFSWTTTPGGQPPTATPPAGTYAGRVHVGLGTTTAAAEIRYTTDGTDPDAASPLYAGLLAFTQTTTLKARLFSTTGAFDPSPVGEHLYTITPPAGAIAAGDGFSVAADPGGAVWAWGSGGAGQLGNGTTHDFSDPVPLESLTGIVAVSAGGAHALALGSDGRAWSWGDNSMGQIGTGTPGGTQLTPVEVPGLSSVVAVAAGESHSLALTADGTVHATGSNSSGQLGDGTTDDRASPAAVPGLTNIVAVAAGGLHSLALGADGRVWAWGENQDGQIGDDGTEPQALSPVEVLTGAVAIAAGATHSLAILNDGSAWGWGGQAGGGSMTPAAIEEGYCDEVDCYLSPLAGVTTAAGGGDHSLALRDDRAVLSWGNDYFGQLGRDGDEYAKPVPGVADGVAIAAGGNHSLAITVSGEIWAWGGNQSGQIGDGTTETRWDPVLVVPAGFAWRLPRPVMSPPPGLYTDALDVSVTTPVAGALIRYTTDGSEPTESSTVVVGPIPVAGSTDLKARTFKGGLTPSATAGGSYTLHFGILDPPVPSPAGGTYVTSVEVTLTAAPGATISFELCDPGWSNCTGPAEYTSPLEIDRSRILQASASQPDWATSTTLTETYTVQVAQPLLSPAGGAYPPGQLITVTCPAPGPTLHYTTNGTDPTENDPQLACGGSVPAAEFTLKVRAFQPGLSSTVAVASYTLTGDLTAAAVVGGRNHSLALLPNGHLWAWGQNTSGQIGEPGGDAGLGPTRVSALAAVTSVAAGDAHTLATTSDGFLWAWGANTWGQLGDGTTTSHPVPVRVLGLTDVVSVAAGENHSLALRSDGTVWASGENQSGQLGDGTTTSRANPVQVLTLTDAVAIAAGTSHSLAIRSDGSVWAWGGNLSGQVGDGGTEDRHEPVAVTALTSGVVSLSAGLDHSLAITADGTVYAWGANALGQLGLGDLDDRLEPVAVPGPSGALTVSAGRGHSLALTSGGTAWAWGLNSWGQLGDGTTANRTVPEAIAGLPALTGLATGGFHSMALAQDGRTWGWGSSGSRQVGDWTTVNRTAPVQISDAAFTWRASTPTISPPSGTHTSELSVDTATATPGADVRYTLDGTEPTEISPIATGAIAVDQPVTLRARAFRGDLAPSSVATADYTLEVPVPLLSPGGGTHHQFVEVTVTSTAGQVTLRYTHDGTEPTESDPQVVAGTTIYVGESGRLSVKGWRAGWNPSATATGDYVITDPRPLDSDGDGLSDLDEAAIGSDPDNPDTNGDGLPDGAAYAAGVSVTDMDVDADGLANLDEAIAGTDPFDPDSDGDTALDGVDCHPLDPARSACLPSDPNDVTPPAITLDEPASAVLVGSAP